MSKLSYRSYGKINLYLDVLDRRDDGFTNIETIFQSITCWDELTVAPAARDITLTCSDATLEGPDNLMYRAATLLQTRAGVQAGAMLHLEKRLPIAAGLAGGSGNAAATLIALNECWALNWSPARLAALALELGSDVPFCLVGGTVAATGRGECLEVLPPIAPRWLVLVHPPLAVTAGYAYGHPQLTRNLSTPVEGKTPEFRRALSHAAHGAVESLVFNRMESGILCDHPELAIIKQTLLNLGCTASAMSGSGPTVFGLCADEDHARVVAARVTAYRTSVVQTIDHGVSRV